MPRLTLSGIVLDSADPHALSEFYQRLLGWPVIQNESDWVKLGAPAGPGLSFQLEPDYVRPTWPAAAQHQQMMVHLDILVDDLEEAGAHAQAQGATLADFQPQEDVRVYLDPDGHPFCLFLPGA
jgi:catechol 2,3-dioxygenase-like lactoylglutathione lyase family enzyme